MIVVGWRPAFRSEWPFMFNNNNNRRLVILMFNLLLLTSYYYFLNLDTVLIQNTRGTQLGVGSPSWTTSENECRLVPKFTTTITN